MITDCGFGTVILENKQSLMNIRNHFQWKTLNHPKNLLNNIGRRKEQESLYLDKYTQLFEV